MTEYLQFPIRSDKLSMSVHIKEHLYFAKTDFQQIDIYETEAFGKILFLDGHVQLAELDEHVYHEGLVQVPLLNIPSPRTALVVGGGDGGVLREICRHKSIEKVDMVEIDGGVVQACRAHLPFLSDGAFDDPRVHLHIADAFPFVKNSQESYDLIVVDSTDVYEEEEGELSAQLFTEEFYKDIHRLLSDRGIVVTQADNLVFCPYSLEEIRAIYDGVFEQTGSYFAVIPSFGGFSGYCWGSKGAVIASRWSELGTTDLPLRYLNQQSYDFGMSALPFVCKPEPDPLL